MTIDEIKKKKMRILLEDEETEIFNAAKKTYQPVLNLLHCF